MEENNTRNKIKKEDKKYLLKFIISFVAALILGALVGACGTGALNNLSQKGVEPMELLMDLKPSISVFSAYALVVFSVGMFIILSISISSHLKQLRKWDGENEEEYDRFDHALGMDLMFASIYMMGEFLLYGMAISSIDYLLEYSLLLFFFTLVAFMASLFGNMFLQKAVINNYKLLNPEKNGSVYDTKFQKKWYESCDEAEQKMIGRAAKKAFDVTGATCLILEVVLILMNMFLSVGLMAHVVVILICMISTISFQLEASKMQ